MDLAQEVDRLLLHDHLVDRPPHQHWALCGEVGVRAFERAHSVTRLLNKNAQELTVDDQLGGVAVPLPHHVGPHAHVHPGVALPGVRDHQLAAPHLENSRRDKQEITGCHPSAKIIHVWILINPSHLACNCEYYRNLLADESMRPQLT